MLRLDINLLFTVINLIIIYLIIQKLLFKPVKNIMAKREAEINKQYEDVSAAKTEADKLKKQYEETISQAEQVKVEALNEARATAGEEYTKIVSDAKTEADKLIDNAKKTAKIEQEKMVKEAKEQIADLVISATAKVVAAKQNEEADRELYNKFLAETGED